MCPKLLIFYIKGELRTKAVDNFVDNNNIQRVYYYKNSIFVRLVKK